MPHDPTRQARREPADVPMHNAAVRARYGSASLEGTVSISTAGLLAIGGLVSGILLSTAVLVLAATRRAPPRRLLR